MTTEAQPITQGWDRPRRAGRYHYFVGAQFTSCGVRTWRIGPNPTSDGAAIPPPGPCQSCLRSLAKRAAQRPQPEPAPLWMPDAPGFTIHPGRGQVRIELECQHQHGLVYVTEGAEMNWVCSNRRRPAHSLAGFFKELTQLKDARVRELMQRWGLYFRPLPLAEPADEPPQS
jgi:hypothetical protein